MIVVALVWWFLRSLDLDKLGHDLAAARPWPLVVAAVFNFGMLWGKAACWRIMLAPKHTVPTGRLMRYTIATFAASAIAPARAGEVLRVWVLKTREGVPVADSAAAALGEKLIDGVSMLIIVAPLPFLVPELPAWVGYSILGCAAVALVAFVALYIAVGRTGEATDGSWLRRFIAGFHVVRTPKRLLACIGVLLGVWILDLASVLLVLYAVGLDEPIGVGVLVLFTLNLAIMLPSTPAQLGALELGAVGALAIVHAPEEPSFAFALLYHGLQVIPLLVAGLILELPLVLGRVRPPPDATTTTSPE